ncbi:MAG: hypothetical protein R2854_02160 [Caldilineaceae bacterium]
MMWVALVAAHHGHLLDLRLGSDDGTGDRFRLQRQAAFTRSRRVRLAPPRRRL